MATYIPNVTDTFPDIQPFRPDYQFLQSALQYKQSKFDTAFNQINSVYGSILNAPLTRAINQERRDEFIKAADSELKKITSLDLSLPQNVQMASNVFKPFYEDENIVKDITWTKNWNNELQTAESYKDCNTKDCQDKYWDTGVKALMYQKQEFAQADDDQALKTGKARYVPYVNVNKMAFDYIKEAGFEIKTAPNLNGRWMITHTNGKHAVAPMLNYVSLIMGNDPKVKDYYKTMEYVQYNDYITQQTPILGSKELAQKAYADQILSTAPKQFNSVVTKLKEDYNRTNIRVGDNEDLIRSKGIIPGSDEHKNYLEALKERDVLKAAVEVVDLEESNLNKISDYVMKARALKRNVDMIGDLTKTANVAAYIKTSTDVKANPYALADHKLENSKKLERFKKRLEKEEEEARIKASVLTIPTTPGGDIDLGKAVDVNRNVISEATQKNIRDMATFISKVSGIQGSPISFNGKEVSAKELMRLASDPKNNAAIAGIFKDYSSFVQDGKGKTNTDLVNLYRNISQTSDIVEKVNEKFEGSYSNALNSFMQSDLFKENKGSYFNVDNLSKNKKPVSEEEYVRSYIAKYNATDPSARPGSGSRYMTTSGGVGFAPVNPFFPGASSAGTGTREEVIREQAKKEYRTIMQGLSGFYDEQSVYSAYNDLYASGQINLGTGLMNVGASEIVYDPTKMNVIAQSQMQSLINSFKRNSMESLIRVGDASEKGEVATSEKGKQLSALVDRTLLDAVTASKGEGRYVTAIQYQGAVAGDPNLVSYQISLSDDAISNIKSSNEELHDEIMNNGGKVSIQIPKGLDNNPLKAASQNIDPIKTRINMSETGSYTFNVPEGGYATITELQDGVIMVSGALEKYDPVTGNFKIVETNVEAVSVNPGGYTETYNNLMNVFNNQQEQNKRQKTANLAVNGVKDPNLLK